MNIDFILPTQEKNRLNNEITVEIKEAFDKKGGNNHLLFAPTNKHEPQTFIHDLFSSAPDATFVINGILPDQEGRTLADLLAIPHLAYILDTPTMYYELAKSLYTIMLSPDQEYTQLFEEVGARKTCFFPAGVNIPTEPLKPFEQRSIDFLMTPQLIDTQKIKTTWESTLPEMLVGMLEEVAYLTLCQNNRSFNTIFLEALNLSTVKEREEMKPHLQLPLFHELEMYIRGKDQWALFKALAHQTLHLWVRKEEKSRWEALLAPLNGTIHYHEGNQFQELSTLLKETKIYLSSEPQFKRGTSGGSLLALAHKAFAFSSTNAWLEEHFSEPSGLFFYPYLESELIEETALSLLRDPNTTQKKIDTGHERVIHEHTWSHRAQSLIDTMPQLLSGLNNAAKLAKEKAKIG